MSQSATVPNYHCILLTILLHSIKLITITIKAKLFIIHHNAK